ncbi:uncharacterized protein TNIN_6861 [Trichonephila inaurata madagascariensis]|uniref:Uncharacterized protein n=2 Tax=Trichonephila inaurata madagascariensis TaxID=2747483 RepID=A0A8X7BN98_9ARAC|nr:uncharacterized protein TNIN_6861 [Trichonephila inaurata madagascariensis]
MIVSFSTAISFTGVKNTNGRLHIMTLVFRITKQAMVEWKKWVVKRPHVTGKFKAFRSTAKNAKHLQAIAKKNEVLQGVIKTIFSKKAVKLTALATVVGVSISYIDNYIQSNSGCFLRSGSSVCKVKALSCWQPGVVDKVPFCPDQILENTCNGYNEDVEKTCCRILVSRTLVDVGCGNWNSVASRMDCMACIQENKAKMIKYLQTLWLPNDELIAHICKKRHLDPSLFPRYTTPKLFERRITLDIVQSKYVVAKEYIEPLLKNKEEYGYLYHLMKQNVYIQFDVKFNGELVIECARYDQVVDAIDELAREWACKNSLTYEVTGLELFFFILLINPEINWMTVDFILQRTKGHAHLIAARAKQLSEKLVNKQ